MGGLYCFSYFLLFVTVGVTLIWNYIVLALLKSYSLDIYTDETAGW
jgi:hypothetical protein